MNKKKATPEPESHLQSFYPEAEDGTAPQAIIVLSRLNSRVNSEFLFFLLTLFFLPFSWIHHDHTFPASGGIW